MESKVKGIPEPETGGKGFSLALMLDGTMLRFRGEE
jgi:hypothetical protein